MIPYTLMPSNATLPKARTTDMRGIFKHSGDRQYFMCFYTVVLTFLSDNYQSSWVLRGYEGEHTEINLEPWEIGQMLGGN